MNSYFKFSYLIYILFFVLLHSCNSIDSLYKLKNDYLKKENSKLFLKPYDEAIMNTNPYIEYILDSKDSLSLSHFAHCKKLCDYTKIPFSYQSVSNFNKTASIQKTAKVLVIRNTKSLHKNVIPAILKFVANGGTLLLASAIEDQRFLFFMGVNPKANLEYNVENKGIYMEDEILSGNNNSSILESAGHFAYSKSNFSEKTKVIWWSDSNKKMPVLLEKKLGHGKVLYFNSNKEFFKKDRGLLFSLLIKGMSGVPYPVANTSTIFLDDFPSPLYNDKKEPIKTEFNLNMRDYVNKIWWPDMKNLANEYNLKYTAMLTFDYDDNIKAPFSFKQWDFSKLKLGSKKIKIASNYITNDILKEKHELGFHGYNHISLTKKEWKDPVQIELSLRASKKKWLVNNFSNYPVTYVPPSNIIDNYGIENLKKGMESLTVFSSLYIGDLEEGSDREFDYEPYNKSFFDYPRISSGFYLENKESYDIYSTFLYTGIWTHFVHPDDVYQIKNKKEKNKKSYLYDYRNKYGLLWKKRKKSLYGSFRNFIKKYKDIYPQTRFFSAQEATPKVIDWRASRFVYSQTNHLLTVKEETNFYEKNGTAWFVYFNDFTPSILNEIKKQSSDFSVHDYMGGKLVFLNGKNTLTFTQPISTINDLSVETKVLNEYNDFTKERLQFLVNSTKVYTEKDFLLEIEKEKKRLLKLILDSPMINYDIWNKYAHYMSWDNHGDDVWELLEKHCSKYPSQHNINYSFELAKILGYSSEKLHRTWITKQYQWNKDNLNVLKEYLSIIISTNEYEEIENVLERIVAIEPICANEEAYISHLLLYKKEKALKFLEKINPSTAHFNDFIVSDICWNYINEKEDYQNAINWSEYSDLIGFETKLSWMFELKQYIVMEDEYRKYIKMHPDDDSVRAKMFYIYQTLGKYDESFAIANEITNQESLEEIIPYINNNIVYLDTEEQERIVTKYPKLFTQETIDLIHEKIKLLYGDFIEAKSSTSMFVKQLSNFKNDAQYTHFDHKKNQHNFIIQQNDLYSLESINDQSKITLYGISYSFKKKEDKNKNDFSYTYGGGIENTLNNHIYFKANCGLKWNTRKSNFSTNLLFNPVEFKDSYENKIYQGQFNIGYVHNFNYLTIESYSETNYYSSINLFNSSVNIKLKAPTRFDKKIRLVPYFDGFYQFSNTQEDILLTPVYLIKQRTFAGLATELSTGNEFSRFKGTLSSGYYWDSFVTNFINIKSNIEYRFLKYTSIKAGCDLNLESKYYFNTYNVGLKHIF